MFNCLTLHQQFTVLTDIGSMLIEGIWHATSSTPKADCSTTHPLVCLVAYNLRSNVGRLVPEIISPCLVTEIVNGLGKF